MMRWSLISLIVVASAATGCSHPAGGTVEGPGTYRDPAGWTIDVPEGWRAAHFALHNATSSAEGVQVSNVGALPVPTEEPETPLQTSSLVVPRSGIAVVIATDLGPQANEGRVFAPPLSIRNMTEGSGLGALLDTMWFRGDGRTFILTAKISDGSYGRPYRALAELIRSLRFE